MFDEDMKTFYATLALVVISTLIGDAKAQECIGGFHVIAFAETNGNFAITHLEAGPSPIVLSEPVKDLDHAIRLVGKSLSFVPPKRAGRFKDWILFPRLDVAKDDLSFSSGFAVQIGSRVLQKWHGDEKPNQSSQAIGAAQPER